ncbi:MAG: hypothetical protein ACI8TX_000476 [Hyphomicrobiaceae bacterium]|jgi:hypothetical protein
MNVKKILLWFVLIDFSALTAWAIWHVGYLGIFEAAMASPGSIQLGVDLVIALTLFMGWMVQDAQRRGVAAWPWVVATLFLGSLAPLAYLVRRESTATN